MTKTKQKTLALFGIAMFFALVSIGGYAVLFTAIKNKTIATTPLTEKVDELSGREERITSSISTLRTQDANIKKLSESFFKESEVVEFTKKIEALGELSKTNFALKSLDQGVTEKTVPYLNFQVTATGSFVDIQRLLILLENFPGKIEWKTVNLSLEKSGAPVAPPEKTKTATKASGSSLATWKLDAFLTARNFIN